MKYFMILIILMMIGSYVVNEQRFIYLNKKIISLETRLFKLSNQKLKIQDEHDTNIISVAAAGNIDEVRQYIKQVGMVT